MNVEKSVKKPKAIIIGGDFQGLSVLRCLGQHKIPITLLDNEWNISRFSRYKKHFVKSPDIRDEATYLHFLIKLAEKDGLAGSVIFSNNDATVSFLSKHKHELEQYYRIPTPEWEITRYLYDKKMTYQLAKSLGIPIPKTYCFDNRNEFLKSNLQFPVIIKPAIREHFYPKTKIKAFKIENEEELKIVYEKVHAVIPDSEILIQEFIPGGPNQLYSYCPLFKEGKVLSSIMAHRKRQHPMDFGRTTTFAETANIPVLEEMSIRLLTKINYYGMAEVEFMYDERDQTFKLIEVNPRFWGWHSLAIEAGVPFPYLLYLDMINNSYELKNGFREMKWIRLITDTPTVFMEILKRKMSLKEYIASLKGDKVEATFRWEDPLPFIMEILMLPYLWYKRGF